MFGHNGAGAIGVDGSLLYQARSMAVRDMSSTFAGANSFNQPLDWDVSDAEGVWGILGPRRRSGGFLPEVLEGFWHVVWGASRPLRRGRRVRGPWRGVSGGVEVPVEVQGLRFCPG